MEYFPAPLEALVEQFARLPGIGSKSAQRLAFHVLSLPEAEAEAFANAILNAKRTVTFCPVCRNLTAGGLCPICASPKRDGSIDTIWKTLEELRDLRPDFISVTYSAGGSGSDHAARRKFLSVVLYSGGLSGSRPIPSVSAVLPPQPTAANSPIPSVTPG